MWKYASFLLFSTSSKDCLGSLPCLKAHTGGLVHSLLWYLICFKSSSIFKQWNIMTINKKYFCYSADRIIPCSKKMWAGQRISTPEWSVLSRHGPICLTSLFTPVKFMSALLKWHTPCTRKQKWWKRPPARFARFALHLDQVTVTYCFCATSGYR